MSYYKRKQVSIAPVVICAIIFFIALWFCTPPGNKFAQLCLYGNHMQYFIAKLTTPQEDLNRWAFHRNNAIYLALMDNQTSSIKEMNKAIHYFPLYKSEQELEALYAERAYLYTYWGQYRAALTDYLRIKNPTLIQQFKIAILYKEIGNKKAALTYCNRVINTDATAYIGYACIADLYASVGNYKTSIRLYDLLIDKTCGRARYFADRALYKKLAGDLEGYQIDRKKATELGGNIDEYPPIFEEMLRPKKVNLKMAKI